MEALAEVANFSKFHFSRIFHSIVGETPFQFIVRLRIEKAASLITTNKNDSISEIAFRCGFSDISIFSRYFKNYFKVSATEFRKLNLKNSNISKLISNKNQGDNNVSTYFCPELQTIKWRTNMEINKNVEVKRLPKMTVAYIRNIGPYNGDQKNFQKNRDKIFAWAAARDLLSCKEFKFLVIYHDDPNVAMGENLRMSLCIGVPPETAVGGEIGKMEIEEAKYVVARFEITAIDFQKAWDWVYGSWLPSSGYEPDDKPCFEIYTEEPKNGNYKIDICVPVKAI